MSRWLPRMQALLWCVLLSSMKVAIIILTLRISWLFFFQAEDGIRDADVTGVQTCALPISGSLYALIRTDGKFLARYPALRDRERQLEPGSALHTAIAEGWERVIYTIPHSQLDAVERRMGFRKLEGFPVYAVAGIDAPAIRAEWLATMASHLVFGLLATLFLFLIFGIALQRT